MRKKILAIMFLLFMCMMPMVNAQGEITNINESILPQDTYSFEIATSVEGDVLYLNLSVTDDMDIGIQVYRGFNQLPVNEVYNGGGHGDFELNITLLGGTHMVYVYNPSLDTVIFVYGFWAINYEPEITTTTTTTPTTEFTETTGITTGPTQPVNYFAIFMHVMVTWVIPGLVFLLVMFCVCNYFRAENYDYLAIFSEDELVGNRDRYEGKDKSG